MCVCVGFESVSVSPLRFAIPNNGAIHQPPSASNLSKCSQKKLNYLNCGGKDGGKDGGEGGGEEGLNQSEKDS